MVHCNCWFTCLSPASWAVGTWEQTCAAATGQNSTVIGARFWTLQGLFSFPHRISRGFRKWGRGRQEFCDFRMSQLKMGEEKCPAEGVSFFQGFISPSGNDSPPTRVSHCLELAVSPRVNFRSAGGGRSAVGGKSSLSSLWGP